MDVPCYKTGGVEFHCNTHWVFVGEDGEVAHMPTDRIKYHCFACGKTWFKPPLQVNNKTQSRG